MFKPVQKEKRRKERKDRKKKYREREKGGEHEIQEKKSKRERK